MSNIGNGNKGKFTERLKRMRLFRLNKKSKVNKEELIEDSEMMYKNFMKVVAVIPLVVADNVFEKNNDGKKNVDLKIDNKETGSIELDNRKIINDKFLRSQERRKKVEEINSIDVSQIKKKQDNYNQVNDNMDNYTNKETKFDDNKNTYEYVKQLEKKIINLIKKDLIKTVNELEILESELYILSQVNGDEKTLSECRKNLDEVKKILCKIDKLKEKYDYLKDNYDFEYLFELDNNELVDCIIELKNKFDKNEVKGTVEDYKLLDVYKYLYLRIDQIHDDTAKFEEEKKIKEEELRKRDVDFEKLKEKVYDINSINEKYNYFVNEQNEFLSDLENKISKINSYESVDYKLKGLNTFMLNSFKYLGLLMMSPLRGIVPAITSQTLIAKNIVSNLYKNLKWEEQRKMVYEATDFSSNLNNTLSDLDYASGMVDSTLDDLIRLKIEYNNKFRQYQGDFLQYRNVIRKINDMENKILGSKVKIEIMKSRTLEYKKENDKKLKLVKKLNQEENNK